MVLESRLFDEKTINYILCFCSVRLGLLDVLQKNLSKLKKFTATKLQKKLDHKDSFVLIIERENCPYCESLQEYIKQTKDEHPNLVLYKIDSTNYGFSKISQDSVARQSSTEDGKILLDMAPYFLYTPTLYVIENGKATHAGIGYSEDDHSVSLWDVDSTVDFDLADTQRVLGVLETYE